MTEVQAALTGERDLVKLRDPTDWDMDTVCVGITPEEELLTPIRALPI